MRSFAAGVAGLLAVLLLPVALLVAWVVNVGTDTNAFVTEMRPVVSTPQVRQALTDRVVSTVMGQLKLPKAVAQQVDPPLRLLVAEAVARPEVEQAWTQGIRGAHQQFIDVMDGERAARVDARGRVIMPLSIPLPGAGETLRAFGITSPTLLAPSVSIPLFNANDLAPAQRVYAVGSSAGPRAPWIVVGLALMSILLARNRIRTVALLGVGGIVAAVALAGLIVVGRTPTVGAVPDPTGAAVVDAAYGLVSEGLMGEARLTLVVSVALVAVAALLSAIRVMHARRG